MNLISLWTFESSLMTSSISNDLFVIESTLETLTVISFVDDDTDSSKNYIKLIYQNMFTGYITWVYYGESKFYSKIVLNYPYLYFISSLPGQEWFLKVYCLTNNTFIGNVAISFVSKYHNSFDLSAFNDKIVYTFL